MKFEKKYFSFSVQMMKNILIIMTVTYLLSCKEYSDKKSFKENHGLSKPLFQIINLKDYKILYVYGSRIPQDTIATYVLYHRGSKKPDLKVPAIYIPTPVKKIVCFSSIYIGAFEKLNELENIVAVDNKNYIWSELLSNQINSGKIKEVGITGNIDVENTLLLKPELVFTFVSSQNSDRGLVRLNESGVPTVFCTEQYESDPLKRAEWIKFLAAFFEKEKMADSLFKLTEENYLSLREKVNNQILDKKITRPSVITEIIYNGTWFVPGGKSYMSTLLKDAGADYFWKDDINKGSLPLSYEAVYVKAKSANFWLNVQGWESLSDCINQDTRNSEFRAFKKKNIYNNTLLKNKNGANAYWEKGVFNPEEILKDLIKIFHPGILPEHQLKYYRKLS
ncbi:MAG: ABC transporter substrate-binding protein [Bacteroidota bacterium]